MKRLIKTAVCLFLVLCLTGCSFGVISNEPPTKKEGSGEVTLITEEETTKPSATATTTAATTTTATTTTATTTTTKTTTTTSKKADTTATTQTTTATTQKTTQANCCYLTIECFKTKKNLYLLNRYKCKYKKGDTVYDILKRSCKKNKIPIGEKSTGYGIYIYSIDNMDEDYFGHKKGGWTYTVNGEMIMKSVDKCEVNKGDIIQFSYVLVN